MNTSIRWGNQHSLEIEERQHDLRLTLEVVKPSVTKRYHAVPPPEVTRSMIEQSWSEQGSQWAEVWKLDLRVEKGKNECGGILDPFIAIRMIYLPVGMLIWIVYHQDDAPDDKFGFSPMTKEQFANMAEQALSLRN